MNLEEKVKDILNTVPVNLIVDKTGVSDRIVYLWKSGERNPSEKHLRRILKLEDVCKRIKKGSYEGFTDASKVQPIRLNRKDFDLELKDHYADVIYFGDYHKGHPQCNEKLGEATIDYSLKYKIPLILMGDIVEFGQKGSPGDSVFTQKAIQYQLDYLEDRFKQHAEKGLIWGLLDGNHEYRVMKQTGVDISKIICKILNIPYLHSACWHLHKVGGQFYSVYTIHGASGAQFTWTKLGYYVRVANNFQCDLFVGAHVHELANTVVKSQRINADKKGIEEFDKHIVITGGFLDYDLSYGQRLGYNIPTLGSAKARFYADEHKITIHDVFQGKELRPSEWTVKE
jgi:hypothetical protein